MPHFESINFHHNNPEMKLFLQKNKIFRKLGVEAPGGTFRPSPPLQICGYPPDTRRVLLLLPSFGVLL